MDIHYDNMTDEAMIQRVRQGDLDATDYLLNKYRGLVKKEARTMYLIGSDAEDLIQEGMIGLFKAIRDYSFEKETSFFSFAKICITRQVYSAVTASTRKKHAPLNSYISLYSPINQEDTEVTLLDTIQASEKKSNPEKMVIDKERVTMIEYGIVRRLSTMERQVIQLYLDGKGYVEIAEVLGKKPKSIDNAIQRIRKKLSDM